jgi:hypothetical protein
MPFSICIPYYFLCQLRSVSFQEWKGERVRGKWGGGELWQQLILETGFPVPKGNRLNCLRWNQRDIRRLDKKLLLNLKSYI